MNRRPQHRVDRPTLQGSRLGGQHWAFIVQRAADAIQDAAQQFFTDRRLLDPINGAAAKWCWAVYPECRAGRFKSHHLGARSKAIDIIGRHQVKLLAGKTNDFSFDRRAAQRINTTGAPQRQFEPHGLHDQPVNPRQAANWP